MAVTSIWPIKGRIGKVIEYARNPEKTTEKSLEKQAALHAIGDVIEYAANDMKTEQRCYVTGINCREDEAAKQFMETKEFWSRQRGEDMTGGRVCFHGYQSFAAGEVNAETAHEIGVKLAQRLWGEQFEVLVATHCNTGHYHNHLIVNSVSWRDGHRFHNGPEDYSAMKEASDRLCLEYGLSVIEEPTGRGKNYSEWDAEKNGKLTVRGLIRQDIDQAIQMSLTEREFLAELEQKGYELKFRSDSGTVLKHPAIRPPGAKGFFRFHKLGPGYSLDEISERILKNRRRKLPFPEDEQEELRRYRNETQPRPKLKGIHALYIRYCYELHILQKFPASFKRVSFLMREDLAKLDKLDEQTRFLAENKIETMEELQAFGERTSEESAALTEERKQLRNALKRADRQDDSAAAEQIRAQIAQISAILKRKRKQLSLCEAVLARSQPMEQALEELAEQQHENERREEKTNEHLLGGRGRTGREDEPRRR